MNKPTKRGEIALSTVIIAVIGILVLVIVAFIVINGLKGPEDTLGSCTNAPNGYCNSGPSCNPGELTYAVGNPECQKLSGNSAVCCIKN